MRGQMGDMAGAAMPCPADYTDELMARGKSAVAGELDRLAGTLMERMDLADLQHAWNDDEVLEEVVQELEATRDFDAVVSDIVGWADWDLTDDEGQWRTYRMAATMVVEVAIDKASSDAAKLDRARRAESEGLAVITTTRSVWISGVGFATGSRADMAEALAWAELTDPKFWGSWKLSGRRLLADGSMRFDFDRLDEDNDFGRWTENDL